VIALLQLVSRAEVEVGSETVGAIGRGLAVFLGVALGDDASVAERLVERVLAYRVFPDAAGRMNLSLLDVGAALLVVPQFTLCADTAKGLRPSFSSAAAPEEARRLYEHFLALARLRLASVAGGRFGAHMRVSLCNDGPVSFWLEVRPPRVT
jgi:D-tyrosyl-tRNA(Tyr) deacylase